jgi:hypothetical protein
LKTANEIDLLEHREFYGRAMGYSIATDFGGHVASNLIT